MYSNCRLPIGREVWVMGLTSRERFWASHAYTVMLDSQRLEIKFLHYLSNEWFKSREKLLFSFPGVCFPNRQCLTRAPTATEHCRGGENCTHTVSLTRLFYKWSDSPFLFHLGRRKMLHCMLRRNAWLNCRQQERCLRYGHTSV